MGESIHGHEVMKMMIASGKNYTKDSLEENIIERFGADARFRACTAENMTPKEIIGMTCYELIHGTNEPWPNCPHKIVLDTKEPRREEFFEPKLGKHIEVSSSPVLDENDEVTGSVHITKNITKRKLAEQEQ